MKYLISGSANPFYKSGDFIKFIKETNSKRVVVMCEHHSSGGNYAWDKLVQNTNWKENNIEFINGDYKFFDEKNLDDYDGLYITGGLTDSLMTFLREREIYDKVKSFVFNSDKLYVGASAGTLMIGKKFDTEPEPDVAYLSRFCDEGFGFFPDVLFQVHFGEGNNTDYLTNRIKKTLKENPDLKIAYALEGDCCIKFKDFSKCEFEALSGKYHTFKNNN